MVLNAAAIAVNLTTLARLYNTRQVSEKNRGLINGVIDAQAERIDELTAEVEILQALLSAALRDGAA
jgi:hypothetical protein